MVYFDLILFLFSSKNPIVGQTSYSISLFFSLKSIFFLNLFFAFNVGYNLQVTTYLISIRNILEIFLSFVLDQLYFHRNVISSDQRIERADNEFGQYDIVKPLYKDIADGFVRIQP